MLLIALTPLMSQVEVNLNRINPIYNAGETAIFQVTATYSASATYEIIYDNEVDIITSGNINLTAGQAYNIPYKHNEAGLVICRVNLNGVISEAAAAFSPLNIQPLEAEPDDFDVFWAEQRNLKNRLPMDPQLNYLSENAYQTTYKISLANIEGRRVYGYISVPKGEGPFPASIILPPYGSSNAVVGADTESAEKAGVIAVSLSVHNAPVDQNPSSPYSPDINSDKEKFYYRYVLIGAMHIIDYLETRSDFNGNVCAMGVSQGGGLSTILAGIDNRVNLLIASNPTMGQHIGYNYKRASGFPYYLSIADDVNQGNSAAFNAVVNATKYYDAMFHARRFKGASYLLTGMEDLVVPSATALAIHNQLPGSKVLLLSRDGGHGHPNQYWNGRFEFMRRHFEKTNTPPFTFGSKNKGFYTDAGVDQTVGTTTNLAAKVFYDTDELTNLAGNWEKIDGPGNVNFSNANALNSGATFSANGVYTLRYTARDDRLLNSEGKIYFIADDVQITATGGQTPVYTLNISCSADQNVQIPSGQNQIAVTWQNPSADSNCPQGAQFFQLSGPQNGSLFEEGTYTITYRATDNCGNQKDCSFTINVSKAANNNSKIDINCPTDIIVSAPAGDTELTVNWAAPIATTTCNSGGNDGTSDCSSTFKAGYTYLGTFDNSQFYLSNEDKNWSDAKVAAESAGGRLAIISNIQENDFIQENINGEIVFIGVSDVAQEGNLIWVDGSPISYNNFPTGFANNEANDFGVLYPWNGKWDLNNQFVVKKYLLEVPCATGNTDTEVIITQTEGSANGSNFSIGTHAISYTFTDACGNTETCSFNIIVNATETNLDLDCPNDFSIDIPIGQETIEVNWDNPTIRTNCPTGASLIQTNGNLSGTQFSEGIYTISYRATNNCGNSMDCSFEIIVNKIAANLDVTCPADQFINVPLGQTTTALTWAKPIANTNCPDDINIRQVSGLSEFSIVGAGIYPIEYQITDICGNTQTCSFNVTVDVPTTNLQVTCPVDQIINVPLGQTTTALTWTKPTANTDCTGEAIITQTGGLAEFSVVNAGIYSIEYQVTDACGNSETCSFNVTVNVSQTSLQVNCPANQIIEMAPGQTTTIISWIQPIATTECTGEVNYTQTGGPQEFIVVEEGTYTINYTISDDCGNQEDCSFNVTVQAIPVNLSINCVGTPTVLEIPANQTDVQITWTDPIINSNCSGGTTLNQISGPSKLSAVVKGRYIISYEVLDNCDNRETCSFIIDVEAASGTGLNPISMDCPADINIEIAAGQTTAFANWTIPTASTTCVDTIHTNTCTEATIEGFSYLGQFENSLYYKSNSPLNFHAASEEAQRQGGHLAIIGSEAENEYIRQNLGVDLCIIGLTDEETEGTFKWIDGSNADYTKFKANLGNFQGNDYAVINFWNGEWELTTDYIHKKYIIEIPCQAESSITPSPVTITQTAGQQSGSSFSLGTTTISYQASDNCGNVQTCSFNINIIQKAAIAPPPMVMINANDTLVKDTFQLNIIFDKPVTGFNGEDITLTNASWTNFEALNNANFSIQIIPINEGEVGIEIPANVAFDNENQGNLSSNMLSIKYQPKDMNHIGNSCLIPVQSLTLESGRTTAGSLNDIINGTGLDDPDNISSTHGGGNLYDGVWLNEGTNAILKFDLGAVKDIDGIAIWNYSYHIWLVLKRRGIKNFMISTSSDDVVYSQNHFFTAGQTSDNGQNETIQIFNFTPTKARYVRLQILNALNDGFYVGLGEVRFTNKCAINAESRNNAASNINLSSIIDQKLSTKVYPNPTTNQFFIELERPYLSKVNIEIINELGAIIQQKTLDLRETELLNVDLKDQPNGMYFVRIKADGEVPILKRVVKVDTL